MGSDGHRAGGAGLGRQTERHGAGHEAGKEMLASHEILQGEWVWCSAGRYGGHVNASRRAADDAATSAHPVVVDRRGPGSRRGATRGSGPGEAAVGELEEHREQRPERHARDDAGQGRVGHDQLGHAGQQHDGGAGAERADRWPPAPVGHGRGEPDDDRGDERGARAREPRPRSRLGQQVLQDHGQERRERSGGHEAHRGRPPPAARRPARPPPRAGAPRVGRRRPAATTRCRSQPRSCAR